MTTSTETHVSDEQLIDYFSDALSLKDYETISDHLVGCDECATRSRKALAACLAVEEAFPDPDRAPELPLEAPILRAAKSATPELQERLSRWLNQAGGRAVGVVEVIREGAVQSFVAATEGLEEFLVPQGGVVFVGAEARRARGAATNSPSGEAKPMFTEVTARQGAACYEARRHWKLGGQLLVKGLSADAEPPLVLADNGDETRAILMQWNPKLQGFTAPIDWPEGDRFNLFFEPR